ncbi:unnamed protein product, partial [Ectocarpus sp. 12 AP-2014]
LCRHTCCRHRGGRRHRAFRPGLASSLLANPCMHAPYSSSSVCVEGVQSVWSS